MQLWEALQVTPGSVVAFTGAGGKTTAMFRLARELVAMGQRVVVTTTTKIWSPTPEQVPHVMLTLRQDRWLTALAEELEISPLVVAASHWGPDGKLWGLNDEAIRAICASQVTHVVLVEADGAGGRSLKAPLGHEPVIPSCTTVVVPMAGLDVVGQPLSAEWVHRPAQVAALSQAVVGEPVTPDVVATVLVHPQGNVKGAPVDARLLPLLNKVDDPLRLCTGREIAKILLSKGLSRVVLAQAVKEPPVIEIIEASVLEPMAPL